MGHAQAVMKGTIPKHLVSRFEILDRLPSNSLDGSPWKERQVFSVGGLTDIGFAGVTDVLLTVSHDGRGIFDCAQKMRTDRDEGIDFKADWNELKVAGFGSLSGKRITVGGLHGGGLPATTTDGWSAEKHPLAWPDEQIFLCPPGQTLLWSRPEQSVDLLKLSNFSAGIRTFGFSPTGRVFVVATSADISIYSR